VNVPVHIHSVPAVRGQINANTTAKQRILLATLILMAVQQLLLVVVPLGTQALFHKPYTWKTIFATNLTQWDGQWLLQIAQSGYMNLAHTAFFPLYPGVVRIVDDVTRLGYSASALLISLVCLAVALYVLGLWMYEQFNLHTSLLGLTMLALFPTSFFFRAAYTESMFLALSVTAVYLSSHRHFFAAGTVVALAALTRNTGALLDIVLLWDYVNSRSMGWTFWKASWWRKVDVNVAGLFFPAVALLLFFIWLKFHTGYFLAFLHAEQVWHRTFGLPWMTIGSSVFQLFQRQQLSNLPYHLLEVGSLCLVLLALGYGLSSARRSSHQMGNYLYLILVLWVCTTAPAKSGNGLHQWDYLLSMSRFVLMMYPVFAYLANAIHRKSTAISLAAVSVVLSCVVYGAFCVGVFIA